jgi:hypothetical protein
MRLRGLVLVQRHAQTLTGAKGQPIQRIVIAETAAGSHPTKRIKEPAVSNTTHAQSSKLGKGAKSKTPQLTSAQKLKAKIEAEKQTKKSSEDELWWKSQLKEIESINDIGGRLNKVDLILRGKRAEKGWLSVEVALYRIHLNFLEWLAYGEEETERVHEECAVRILHSIHQLREHPSLFPTAARILAQALNVLGLDSFTPPEAKVQDERELSFKFVKLLKSKSGKSLYPHLHIKMSTTEFQLKAYGPLMDRSMDSKPDPRVGFEPDGWQRKVRSSCRP